MDGKTTAQAADAPVNMPQDGTVCIDIGGTAIKSGLFEGGALCGLREAKTPPQGGEAVVRLVASIVAGYPGAVCVGVSTAGEVDVEAGSIRQADNIPGYTGLPVRDLLRRMCGLPVALENDVNAAALGEMRFGAAARGNFRDFLMVSYGTGIGGAVVHDGRLLRGATGSAGEIGGMITHPEAADGQVGGGSYEQYASTAALVRRAAGLSPALDSGRAVMAALEEEAVRILVHRWVDEVCYGLVGAIHLLNPQAIILGGGIMQETGLCADIGKRLLPLLKPCFRGVKLLPAALGNQAALHGAALLATAAAGQAVLPPGHSSGGMI